MIIFQLQQTIRFEPVGLNLMLLMLLKKTVCNAHKEWWLLSLQIDFHY